MSPSSAQGAGPPGGRLLWLDPIGGLAGDMLCAALLDAGADEGLLRAELGKLELDGYQLVVSSVLRGVFAARRFDVRPDPGPGLPADAHGHAHAHEHAHAHAHEHEHEHEHGHAHEHGPHPEPWPGQPDRRWSSIRARIAGSGLSAGARNRALAIFSRLAEAEAAVHGCSLDQVAFHEVGAVDSIVDIVSVAIMLDQLGVDQILCGPLPVSAGTVYGAHGVMPLPAPATALLLRGWPIQPGRPGVEQVTPTGAAVLAALGRPAPMPAMTILAVGTGAGGRDPADHPNILRVLLGAPHPAAESSPAQVEVLAAQMDDLSGEHLPALIEALLEGGALDAWASPVLMKKGRTGLLVEALATAAHADEVAQRLLRHGSTFGVRRHTAQRQVLLRQHRTVETPWGPVSIKLGLRGSELLHASPEHGDVARVARQAGVPEPQVHAAALAAWWNRTPEEAE